MAYVPSEDVKKKEKDYYAHLYNNNPGEFASDYTDKAKKALSDYENRGEFKYNPATDIGYQAARKQYVRGGQQAMKDTLGAATELTGGYDNSYAQTAAQQTFNKYMGELAALMPQYEGQAYDRYITEGQQMKDYISILNNAADHDYAMHKDKVAAYENEADRLYTDLMNERGYDYGIYRDNVADEQWERTLAHQQAKDDAAAASSQTKANADYLTALAKYNDSLAANDPIFYEYAGEVLGEDGLTRTGSAFYYDGKKREYDLGINPYTSSKNRDVADGAKTFSNGYQPKQIAVRKDNDKVDYFMDLEDTGDVDYSNGKAQTVWKTTDKKGNVKYWVWDGKLNDYEEVEY